MVTLDAAKSSIETDPIRNFKFVVRIHHAIDGQNLADMGFMNMSGLALTTEVIPYREGGNNTTQRKMPGQTSFSDITLSRGVVLGGPTPWAWVKQIFAVNAGDGVGGPTTDFRTNVDVYVLAHPVTNSLNVPAYAHFKIHNAWISGAAFSELDAGGNAVYVQQLTLAHEGFEFDLASSAGQDVA